MYSTIDSSQMYQLRDRPQIGTHTHTHACAHVQTSKHMKIGRDLLVKQVVEWE